MLCCLYILCCYINITKKVLKKISLIKICFFLEILVDQINGERRSLSLSTQSVHLVSRVPSLGFHFFVFTGERSANRLTVNSVIRLSVCFSCYSFARSSARAFVCVSGLFSCSSVCPVLLAIHGHK